MYPGIAALPHHDAARLTVGWGTASVRGVTRLAAREHSVVCPSGVHRKAARPKCAEGVAMSAYAYGWLTRQRQTQPSGFVAAETNEPETPVQKAADLAAKLAAVVPADILVVYGVVLASTTTTDDKGATTVTNPTLLKWSLPILAVLAAVLYLIGRAPKFDKMDFVRLL